MPDRPMYLEDRVVLRLNGELTNDRTLWIMREIELSVCYYQYRTIGIHISSPGGELDALNDLLAAMSHWTTEAGVRFATHAVGDVASAASLLLAMGTIPYRSATATSRILLHEPRIRLSGAPLTWTQQDVERVGRSLQRANDRLLDILAEHVSAGQRGSAVITAQGGDPSATTAESSLRSYYAQLKREERWLSADEAHVAGLIDIVSGGIRDATEPTLTSSGK